MEYQASLRAGGHWLVQVEQCRAQRVWSLSELRSLSVQYFLKQIMLEGFVGNLSISPPSNIRMYEVSLEGDYPRSWEVGWHVSSEAHHRACVEDSEGLLWPQGSDLSWGLSVWEK